MATKYLKNEIKKGIEDIMDIEEPSNVKKTKIPSNIGIKSKEEKESKKNEYKKDFGTLQTLSIAKKNQEKKNLGIDNNLGAQLESQIMHGVNPSYVISYTLLFYINIFFYIYIYTY